MIAMQYSFVLPADYDMGIIKKRIAEKGHLLDHFPHLILKAYLHASRNTEPVRSRDNLYAPFYLWENSEGMNNFLCGPGFAALVASFGRPSITTWAVWHHELGSELRAARFATRELIAIPPSAALGQLREMEEGQARQDIALHGALGAVTAFEPGSWTLVRLRLWRELGENPERGNRQCYEVGHLSLPGFADGDA